jgi:glycosyltransferase involved in cell wall biosynthesis
VKIAQISPLYEAVPPKLYGGTERVVANLCDALVDLGHDVTLFSSADALTKARLAPVRDQAIRLDPAPYKSDLASHMAMLHEVRLRAAEFDVLHFHTDMIHFPFFEDMAERTLTTLHGRLDLKGLADVYARWPQFPLVSISDAQRAPLQRANWAGTVLHGMPAEVYPFRSTPEGYLLFLGRISPEKGPERAISIAKRVGMPLKIAAKVDQADAQYFREEIQPLLDHPLVEFLGEVGGEPKARLLGGARALLFPVAWPEPFGLVMIEAMACGTPVIAYRYGSVPEVVEDGVSGFVVEGEDGAVGAVRRLGQIDRRRVRALFELRFSATAMARRYLALYGRAGYVAETESPLLQTA